MLLSNKLTISIDMRDGNGVGELNPGLYLFQTMNLYKLGLFTRALSIQSKKKQTKKNAVIIFCSGPAHKSMKAFLLWGF